MHLSVCAGPRIPRKYILIIRSNFAHLRTDLPCNGKIQEWTLLEETAITSLKLIYYKKEVYTNLEKVLDKNIFIL